MKIFVVLLVGVALAVILIVPMRSWCKKQEKRRSAEDFAEIEEFGVLRRPQERTYADLSPELLKQLEQVEPTPDPFLARHPSRVTLKNGERLSCVYVANAQEYIDAMFDWPDDEAGKETILVEDITSIEESPYRMPPVHARHLYEAGEASMGSWRFTAHFRDGSKLAYYNNDSIFDFIASPVGMTNNDIVGIEPHETYDTRSSERGRALEYRWCLYGRGKPSRDIRIKKQ